MTLQEQHEYWLKFHRYQSRYENIYRIKFNAALKIQTKQYINSGTIAAVTALPIYEVLLNLYLTSVAPWAQTATQQIRNQKARMPIGFSERIVELMRSYYGVDLLNDAEDITDTTKKVIQQVLSLAAEEGFGFDEIVRRLDSEELTSARSRLIARTEVVTAANSAAQIAAKETGLVMDKIWISARDHRTRHSHVLINQTTVGIDDTFTVKRYENDL